MKDLESLIDSIDIDKGNFEHIVSCGIVNGTLLIEIRRVAEEYAQSQLKAKDEKIKELIETHEKALAGTEALAKQLGKNGFFGDTINNLKVTIENLKTLL